jgi:DNA-binding MarR family transcriptional regulator
MVVSIDTVNNAMERSKTCANPGSMALLTRLARIAYRLSGEDVLGMHLKHFVAMCYLRDHDGAAQSDLTEAMMLDPNNMVILLNQMEEAGLIERRRDPTDRRRHAVYVTKAGWRALDKAEMNQETIEDDVLAALDEGERTQFYNLLRQALEGEGAIDEDVAAAKVKSKVKSKA